MSVSVASSDRTAPVEHRPAAPRAAAPGAAPTRRTSVVVSSFSAARLAMLERCIASLETQSLPPDEVVLVIDHNPELLARVRRAFGRLRIVENSHARGCSGSRNCGAAAATGDVVVFLDDDAWASPRWLERLLAPYDDPDVLGTAGYVRPAWPTDRPSWFPPEFAWVVGCSYRGLPETATSVRNLWGTMSFRREIFERVGGFDEAMGRVGNKPIGCEDTEFSLRVHAAYPNGRLLFVPEAEIGHHVEPERTTVRYFLRRCYGEGRSKAAVARSAGRAKGLSTERSYVLGVLPGAVARGVRQAFGGEPSGLGSAAAVVAGLATTVTGFVCGSVSRHDRPVAVPAASTRSPREHAPV